MDLNQPGDLRDMVERTLALTKENNKMLRSMRRAARWGFLFRLVVWAVVLLVPLYFFQTYLVPLMNEFRSALPGAATSTPPGFWGLPSLSEIQNLIHSYQSGTRTR